MKINHISPEWDITDFYDLNYKLDKHKDQQLIDNYIATGYASDALTLFNYFEPNPMPDCIYSYIKPYFSFIEKMSVAINLFCPGQFIPQHSDLYQKYMTANEITSIENIVRYIVMLEDGVPGQIIGIGNSTHTMWKAGDCFSWMNTEPHAFYNFSISNRYAVQITGIISDV